MEKLKQSSVFFFSLLILNTPHYILLFFETVFGMRALNIMWGTMQTIKFCSWNKKLCAKIFKDIVCTSHCFAPSPVNGKMADLNEGWLSINFPCKWQFNHPHKATWALFEKPEKKNSCCRNKRWTGRTPTFKTRPPFVADIQELDKWALGPIWFSEYAMTSTSWCLLWERKKKWRKRKTHVHSWNAASSTIMAHLKGPLLRYPPQKMITSRDPEC